VANFEDTASVTTPFTEVVKLTILQRRNDCIESMEHYQKKVLQGYDTDPHVFRSRLYSFWLEIASGYSEAMSKKNSEDKDFVPVSERILSKESTPDDLNKIFSELDLYIYRSRLTKIASFKAYDTTIAESENQANES